ncbi:MAG: gamma carbonic anhydrase family protein [Bacteroidota bacterium]|nr:gamma carbonic anhydrase family protein [Bacteroidota bacterium]
MNYQQELTAKVIKHKSVFIANTAVLLGDIIIGENSSVWYQAVIRADNDQVIIGDGTNIQDFTMIHVDPGMPVKIGNNCIIGHSAIIHGATIGSNTLVGMRATVMNGAMVGEWCVIGAHSLITEGMQIPDYSIVMGSPAKVVKQTSPEMIERIRKNAEAYVELSRKYMK